MKKRAFILLLVITYLVFFLTGCSEYMPDFTGQISAPANNSFLLEGTWIIKERFGGDSNMVSKSGHFQGSSISITNDRISVPEMTWDKVKYKMKRVKTQDYFLHKIQTYPKDIEHDNNEIVIFAASQEGEFLYDFVVFDDKKDVIINIDGAFYYIEKLSDEYQDLHKMDATEDSIREYAVSEKTKISINSGLLLTIRTPEPNDYRSYWISMIDGVPQDISTFSGIFVPRKDGFWKVSVTEVYGEKGIEDAIISVPASILAKEADASFREQSSANIEKGKCKTILYVGNDYLCLETGEYEIQEDGSSKCINRTLSTIPIYNTKISKGLKLSDLTGINGSIAIQEAIADIINSGNVESINNKAKVSWDDTNFALYRKTGHWFFKGRLNFDDGSSLSYLDYNINLIPPSDMVAYDILQIPWNKIKEAVPEADDAYTSPNRNMAVLLSENKVYVYRIIDGALAENPEQEFTIPLGSSVIMAEWCSGDYTEKWRRAIELNNETEQLLLD
jgi:hypothetical protein